VSSPSSIKSLLSAASEVLSSADVAEPVKQARDLLALAIGKDKAFVIAHPEYEPAREELERYVDFVKRRSAHEPFQHISGKQEFFGLSFKVTPDVMIPRPETELIVEAGMRILERSEAPVFCEIGTGSGCISVALLHGLPNAAAVGLDVSPKALGITRENAEANEVADRLELRESDVMSALRGNERFDLIASNPPYVPAQDIVSLQAEVRDHEPHIALTDGGSGLSIIEAIAKGAPDHLRPGGILLLEIGFNQGAAVEAMLRDLSWAEVELFPDLQGIPRMVRARFSDT
jgi:release factor glutamine methyltransferase